MGYFKLNWWEDPSNEKYIKGIIALICIIVVGAFGAASHISKLKSGNAQFYFDQKDGYTLLMAQTEVYPGEESSSIADFPCIADIDSCHEFMIDYLKQKEAIGINIYSEEVSQSFGKPKYALFYEFRLGKAYRKVRMNTDMHKSELDAKVDYINARLE